MREAEEVVEVVVVEEVFDNGNLVELVIIEEFARRGERLPRAKTYAVRIDKHVFHVPLRYAPRVTETRHTEIAFLVCYTRW